MSWADRYRPRSLSELIISTSSLEKISQWLDQWKEGVPVKKALVLYGPPGVGKTSAALAIAHDLGYPFVEMNASDQRNRESMKSIALMAALYQDISSDFGIPGQKKIILIDEADSIFEGRSSETGGDTGGISELLKVIQRTSNPIIITMNNYYEFRRKGAGKGILDSSLAIEFIPYKRRNDTDYKSFKVRLNRKIYEILQAENVNVDQRSVNEIIEKNGTDIRSILNDLESLRNGSSSSGLSLRDSQISIYNVMQDTFRSGDYLKVLGHLYGKDFQTEDYLMWMDKNLPAECVNETDLMESFDLISCADIFIGRVMKKQHYAFKGYAEEIAAGVSFKIKDKNRHYVKYEFPSFIMQMSKLRERRNARKSLSLKMGRLTHMSARYAMEYLWFYNIMDRHSPDFGRYISEKLSLTEPELGVLKRKRL
ncbi:replication factor C large subunit [Oxyplasma meridianum]|uniref:Replication factor C large subunit n=1 Tax=Oxyplasma meridianum TaxID=3073602 RepID=A0AAX4NI05_9ARCH